MLDFFKIKEREGQKKGVLEVYPDFIVTRSKDLMVRAKSFYAIWDEKVGLWSTDEYDVQRLVDEELKNHVLYTEHGDMYDVSRKYLGNFSTNSWLQFRNYIGHLTDNSTTLDENLTFLNSVVKKSDHVSKRLPYSMAAGDISAYKEMFDKLYAPEEMQKLEWAMGAILSGDSKNIQKMIALYGAPGTGKSTWIEFVLQALTEGYYETVNLKELTSANNMFAMDIFRNNPLVAIEHDTDLSKIVDNTKLNSIVSHESMKINEKNKPSYTAKFNAFMVVGTNSAVKFTDSKSGLIRRLIDVRPTGETHGPRKYQTLLSQMQFELGAIAQHCLDVYRELGKSYYSGYRAIEMMLQTDVFFNFIEAYYDVFSGQDGTTLRQAYILYKEFCADSNIEHVIPQFKFREELKNYFGKFEERAEVDGLRVRSWYSEFNADRFKTQTKPEEPKVFSLVMDETISLFDDIMVDMPAQYTNAQGSPIKWWTNAPKIRNDKEYIPKPSEVVSTTLADIDTSKEHYVKLPSNCIVIDFDLTDADGNKSAERNLEAASSWPSTYAEFSKSEAGIHLTYYYDGDPTELSRIYDDGIEIKVFTGDSSLRRKLSACNNIPIATLSSGSLPLKEKKMMNTEGIKSEKSLRDMVERNLRKEIHSGTKPSVDFIHKILEDAYSSGIPYDLTDMRPKILSFANNSTNQALASIKAVNSMQWRSDPDRSEQSTSGTAELDKTEAPIVFYDVEVFPNLFVICWMYDDDNASVVKMINPTALEVEELLQYRLIGFNNRRYDNHIIYGALQSFTNKQLYDLSQKLINGSPNALFGQAYELSYTDIFDFASKKQGLKKWEIELGLPHKEWGLPWDKPVDPALWGDVAKYCANDVKATRHVFHHIKEDFNARQILSLLSGLSVNSTTQQHTAKIVFGTDRRPQEHFVYTKLDELFPGYEFKLGKSYYKGEITGEGGYVYAEPGMYENVAVLDVASMHPTSIEQLDAFGPYTKNFSALKEARIAIKHGDYETAGHMFDGRLKPFLSDPESANALSYALKIVINIVYGLTSAKFDNAFKDPRNIDNIVAKRGALFMILLKLAVQELGYQVIHIKTDSIKIPNADKAIIEFVMDFGNEYGYTFEHEATYDKMCLVNDAVYIAKVPAGKKPAHWEAVGAQFQHPYVFKKLFSHENILFRDKCETKNVVGGAIYLDFTDSEEAMALAKETLQFIGKTGLFCPIKPENGGALLVKEKLIDILGDDGSTSTEQRFYAVTGTKGYHWLEADMVKELGKEKEIDVSYFDNLVDQAVDNISQWGDFEWFVSDDPDFTRRIVSDEVLEIAA